MNDTGYMPRVWQCQNPKCGTILDGGSIGRDGVGEDTELFCTSCASRDIQQITGDKSKHPVLFRSDWPI